MAACRTVDEVCSFVVNAHIRIVNEAHVPAKTHAAELRHPTRLPAFIVTFFFCPAQAMAHCSGFSLTLDGATPAATRNFGPTIAKG